LLVELGSNWFADNSPRYVPSGAYNDAASAGAMLNIIDITNATAKYKLIILAL
jgi:hypothetical protein